MALTSEQSTMSQIRSGNLAAFLSLALISVASSRPALAQRGGNLPDMQTIANSLGVTCEYCHVNPPAFSRQPDAKAEPEPKKDIARAMIAMTRELNEKVQAATGKAPNEVTQVTCATCHHGVAIPGTLSDVLLKSWKEKGGEGMVAKYRELRQQYYGKATYDFSEEALLAVADRLVRVKPGRCPRLLKLDLEYNPKSAKAYAQIGFAYTRKYDDESAIANYEKSLELDPNNGIIEGQLAQLKSYRRNKVN